MQATPYPPLPRHAGIRPTRTRHTSTQQRQPPPMNIQPQQTLTVLAQSSPTPGPAITNEHAMDISIKLLDEIRAGRQEQRKTNDDGWADFK